MTFGKERQYNIIRNFTAKIEKINGKVDTLEEQLSNIRSSGSAFSRSGQLNIIDQEPIIRLQALIQKKRMIC